MFLEFGSEVHAALVAQIAEAEKEMLQMNDDWSKGEVEQDREPDLRRCECMPWARPTIENVENWGLKFWRQTRQRSKNRVCIALETEDETYFVVLEVRDTYVLLWTAFLSEYSHQSSKKIKEYTDWKKNEGANINTPDELIALIQEAIKKARG